MPSLPRGVLFEKGGSLLLVEGFGEVISLSELASQVSQALELAHGFKAFGDDLAAQLMRELNDGFDDFQTVRVLLHPADERSVDFQIAYGKPLQVA